MMHNQDIQSTILKMINAPFYLLYKSNLCLLLCLLHARDFLFFITLYILSRLKLDFYHSIVYHGGIIHVSQKKINTLRNTMPKHNA